MYINFFSSFEFIIGYTDDGKDTNTILIITTEEDGGILHSAYPIQEPTDLPRK